MISFERFVERMRKEQVKRFQGSLNIEVQRIKTNNGVYMTGLIGKKPGDGEGMVVYLDSYYDAYQEGMVLEQLFNDIYDMFNTFEKADLPLNELEHFHQAKDKIFYKLVNYEKNLLLFNDIPHIPYLDLALTFHVIVGRDEKGQSTCMISHKERKKWGIDIETLYEMAKKNTPKLFPVSLCSMGQIMEEISKKYRGNGYIEVGLDELLSAVMSKPLYIAGNTCGVNGAGAVLYPDMLKNFSFMVESDVVLLPFSVHEFVLLPYSNKLDIKSLKKMVEHINRVDVPKTDILSDNVYLYDRENDKISIM